MAARYRIRYYRRYSDASNQVRAQTQRLGTPRGKMRRVAVRHDTRCAVATLLNEVVGWAILEPRTRRNSTDAVMVYVDERHRRKGLATKLIDRLILGKRTSRDLRYWPETKAAAKFYRKYWGANGR